MEFYNGRCANIRCASIFVLKDVIPSRLGILSFFNTLIDARTTLVYTINKSIDILLSTVDIMWLVLTCTPTSLGPCCPA